MSEQLSAIAQRYLRGASREDEELERARELATQLGLPLDDLSEYRGDPELFPEVSLAMVQIGEATGALEAMLFNVSQFYDETIEVRLARLVSLIEPALIIIMGLLVAAMLLSVYLPIFNIIKVAR